MPKWTPKESDGLTKALERVLAENRFWPEQIHHNLINQIIPLAATEVAIVQGGKLLMQYRLFDEWPAPYNKAGCYIMGGGYCFWPEDLHRTCLIHLLKDLCSEYKRVDIEFNTDSVVISEPTILSIDKWLPGEHPFGCPLSILCVCELLEGDVIETDWLKWSTKPIETDVPLHYMLQKKVHFWLNSSPEMKRWLVQMQRIS